MKNDIQTVIREMLKQELEELSTTGAVAGYATPFAFKKTGEEDERELKEARSRYLEFKNDPTASPKQKIGKAISEINRQLNELSRVVEMSARLKTETNMESSHLWKRTAKHLGKIENKMLEISQRIRELKA